VFAIAGSTRAPIGYAARAEIAPGLDIDLPVLVAGAAAVLLVAVGAAVAGALLSTRPQPLSSTAGRRPLAGPLPASVGLRLLGQTARSRSGTSVRVAAATAVAGTVASVAMWAFAGSLGHLVDSPRLQGWEWDLAAGNYSLPESAAAGAEALARDPDVEAFVGFNEQSMFVDGEYMPVAGFDGDGVTPRVLDGRAPSRDGEIALGTATAQSLRKGIGDTVEFSIDSEAPGRQLTVVGLITPPAPLVDGMALDRGASTTLRALEGVATGEDEPDELHPYVHLIRLNPGVAVSDARDRLQADFPGTVNTARPTADVRSLQRVEAIPYLLATMIGLAGVIAVALVLSQLARRRQRELALLRCIGFTGRQLLGVVLWQATAFAAAALAIGVPLGVIAGRWLWRLAADRIGTDAGAAVPLLGIGLAVLGVVALANAFALVPARRASRVHPAVALRAE
jgi:ABC-type lipoprotein release transport system permease subunit